MNNKIAIRIELPDGPTIILIKNGDGEVWELRARKRRWVVPHLALGDLSLLNWFCNDELKPDLSLATRRTYLRMVFKALGPRAVGLVMHKGRHRVYTTRPTIGPDTRWVVVCLDPLSDASDIISGFETREAAEQAARREASLRQAVYVRGRR